MAFYRLMSKRCCHQAANLVLRESHANDTICRLILNNPKKRNALSLSMLDELQEQLTICSKNEKLRVIVLASQPPVFSAGHDLSELSTKSGMEKHNLIFRRCTDVMSMIQSIPMPVIAEVKGMAAAAGCQLMASCDIVVAADNARFSTPGARAGVFCSTPGIAVSRSVNQKMALYMLLTGDAIDANEALRSGLITKAVPEANVESEAIKIAAKICDLSKPVVALGKNFFYTQIGLSTAEAYKRGEKVMVDNLRLKDGQEGIESFVGKRKPIWKHTDEKAH